VKTISLMQPWATLLLSPYKQFETRSWSTPYRGVVAIHASKNFPRWAIELCFQEPFRSVLSAIGIIVPADLPRGVVLGTAELVRVWSALGDPPEPERSFGDFINNQFAWEFREKRIYPKPIPAKGALGLWEWKEPQP